MARIVHLLASLGVATTFSDAAASRAESGQGLGKVLAARNICALQREAKDPKTGRYDWGASVMLDGGVYRMWWVRLGGGRQKRFPYAAMLPDGERFEFTYPDWGDRIYYAESRDGRRWHISGKDYAGAASTFGPDARGPLMVLGPAETPQQRNHVGCPSVIKVADTFYMYYEAPCEYVVERGADGRIIVGNEYQNQIFVAISEDGRTWRNHPDPNRPRPIVAAPELNKRRGAHRYGLGQPSVFYLKGRFVMHYVDSCTGPGDFVVRIEADNPFFANASPFARALRPKAGGVGIPAGAVARFAQMDVKYLGEVTYLLRPAYGTGNLGLLASRDGVFGADANAVHPKDVFPQIAMADPRGPQYLERLYPRFLTNGNGEIVVEGGCVTIYYASGLGFKQHAHTWDLYRCEIPRAEVVPAPDRP